MWLLMTKYDVKQGTIEGVVDNITVVNRVNDGLDDDSSPKSNIAIKMCGMRQMHC